MEYVEAHDHSGRILHNLAGGGQLDLQTHPHAEVPNEHARNPSGFVHIHVPQSRVCDIGLDSTTLFRPVASLGVEQRPSGPSSLSLRSEVNHASDPLPLMRNLKVSVGGGLCQLRPQIGGAGEHSFPEVVRHRRLPVGVPHVVQEPVIGRYWCPGFFYVALFCGGSP